MLRTYGYEEYKEPTEKRSKKRINIISKEVKDEAGKITQQANIIMRTTRSLATRMIETGNWTKTTKNKLKSFLNKEGKLHRNMKAIKTFGATSGQGQWKDNNGKSYTNLSTYRLISIFSDNPQAREARRKLAILNQRLNKAVDMDDKTELINPILNEIDQVKQNFFDKGIYQRGSMRVVTAFKE